MVIPVITSLSVLEPVVINVEDQYKEFLSGFDLSYNKSLNGLCMNPAKISEHITDYWLTHFNVAPLRQIIDTSISVSSVVISPDSRTVARRMPFIFWDTIINYCISVGIPVTIIGPTDATRYNAQFDRPGVLNLTGKQSIGETYSTLKYASAVITTDTGTSHLSDALNDVTITAFALNNYVNYAPFWNRRIALSIDDALTHLGTLINK